LGGPPAGSPPGGGPPPPGLRPAAPTKGGGGGGGGGKKKKTKKLQVGGGGGGGGGGAFFFFPPRGVFFPGDKHCGGVGFTHVGGPRGPSPPPPHPGGGTTFTRHPRQGSFIIFLSYLCSVGDVLAGLGGVGGSMPWGSHTFPTRVCCDALIFLAGVDRTFLPGCAGGGG